MYKTYYKVVYKNKCIKHNLLFIQFGEHEIGRIILH